jgi:hypothetical protein
MGVAGREFVASLQLLAFIHGEDARLGKLDRLLLGAHNVVTADSQSAILDQAQTRSEM